MFRIRVVLVMFCLLLTMGCGRRIIYVTPAEQEPIKITGLRIETPYSIFYRTPDLLPGTTLPYDKLVRVDKKTRSYLEGWKAKEYLFDKDRNGKWTFYNNEDVITKVEIYDNGKLLKTIEYKDGKPVEKNPN